MDLKYTNPRTAEELMVDNLLVKHWAGSHAYGTNIATSDEDYRGIFVCDPVNLLTPFFNIREITDVNEEDTKFYELSHFLKLCLDCNPNIVETLWVDESDILFSTPAYEMLRAARSKLLSSKVAFTFSGYAVAQLRRIKSHNKWINNPQSKLPPRPCNYLKVVQWMRPDKNLKPDISEFCENHRLIPFGGNIYGVFEDSGRVLWNDSGNLNEVVEEGDREKYHTPIMIIKWNKAVYKDAMEMHRNYWIWKKNRNEVRAALEEKYQIDTKFAMHLIRLLRMGEEILTEGVVHVRRSDADELLAIRDGAWSYDQIVKYSEMMDDKIRNKLYKTTMLPKKPDIKFAAKLLMDVQAEIWK